MNKKSPAFYGVLASLALIASYVESLVPLPVPVPGIRLGLANAVVLAVLELFGFREAFLVSVVRILLSGYIKRGALKLWESVWREAWPTISASFWWLPWRYRI